VPSADIVRAGLTAIANDWRWLAIAWHGVLAVLFAALWAGWRPSTRSLARLLIAPLVSVSVVACGEGYRFHGLPPWLSASLIRFVHFVMQCRQLLGIAQRVEATSALIAPLTASVDERRRSA
jgi:hypothetical protein